jgi:methyl-accepting chemotaxis protein
MDDSTTTLAEQYSREIQVELQVYLDTVRALGQAMEVYESIDVEKRRSTFDAFLRRITEKNPDIIATWSGWEPNALDGMDSVYVNTPETDRTGRYLSYWYRSNGKVTVEPLVDYTTGDFYQLPLKTGEEIITEPYTYVAGGKELLIISLVVPIKNNGKVVGVIGIDIDLSIIQDIVGGLRPFDDGLAAAFSNKGIIVGHFDSSRIGKQMRETEQDMAGALLPDFAARLRRASRIIL